MYLLTTYYEEDPFDARKMYAFSTREEARQKLLSAIEDVHGKSLDALIAEGRAEDVLGDGNAIDVYCGDDAYLYRIDWIEPARKALSILGTAGDRVAAAPGYFPIAREWKGELCVFSSFIRGPKEALFQKLAPYWRTTWFRLTERQSGRPIYIQAASMTAVGRRTHGRHTLIYYRARCGGKNSRYIIAESPEEVMAMVNAYEGECPLHCSIEGDAGVSTEWARVAVSSVECVMELAMGTRVMTEAVDLFFQRPFEEVVDMINEAGQAAKKKG